MKRPTFSIRDLLWLTLLVAISCGWFNSEVARRRGNDYINKLDAEIKFKTSEFKKKDDAYNQMQKNLFHATKEILNMKRGKVTESAPPADGQAKAGEG